METEVIIQCSGRNAEERFTVDFGKIFKGDKGDAGEGVPAGGRTGQVLKKKSDGDYDTEWGEDEGITNIAPGAVGTEEIADNAVTELKLTKGVRDNINGKLNKTETSTEPTASTVIRRDNNGRAKVATPEADDDIANKQYVDARVSAVYRFCGTVATFSDLPTEGMRAGDTYNVDDTGANYSWTGDAWDKLSETIDLSGYATKTELAGGIASAQNVVEVSVSLSDAFDEVKILPAEDLAKIKACKNIIALKDSDGAIFSVYVKAESVMQCSLIMDNQMIVQSVYLMIDLSTGKYCNADFDPETDEIYRKNSDDGKFIPYLSMSNIITMRDDGAASDAEIERYYYQDSLLLDFGEDSGEYIIMYRSGNYKDGNPVFVGMKYEGGTDGNTDGGMGIFYKMWLNAANKLCYTASFVKLLSDADFDGGDDVPTIDITGWDGSGFEQNYPRVMTGTISDDDYAKLGKADIIRIAQDGVIFSNAYKTAVLDDGYYFSTGDLGTDASIPNPLVYSYLLEFRKAPTSSSLLMAYKLNIRDKSKEGNFVVLDVNGLPTPSKYKPESFRKASDKIKTDDIAEKAVTESNLSDDVVAKLNGYASKEDVAAVANVATRAASTAADAQTSADAAANAAIAAGSIAQTAKETAESAQTIASGSVRYDAAQELTPTLQEQVSNNVGVPTVFMSESELNTAFSDERAAKIANARIIMFTMNSGNTIPLLRAYENNAQIYFQSWYTNHQYIRCQYDKSNKMASYFLGELSDNYAVHFNSQNLTTSQQLQVRKNIDGMKNTPSGDPMHYMYETAGAEWIPYADISTDGLEDWQVETLDTAQAQADGGVWWHNGIFVTVEQNRINYVSTVGHYPANTPSYQYYLDNLAITTNYKQVATVDDRRGLNASIRKCNNLVAVSLPNLDLNLMSYTFSNCPKLVKVSGILTLSSLSSFTSSFVSVPALRDISLRGLNANIDLSGAPNLSMTSIVYAVTNAGTAAFTITLAPAVYTVAMADADVQAALTSKPNVTLADAGASSSGGN